MNYLIIDAALSGTGIRDKYEGGYLSPEDLDLSFNTINRLKKWLSKYEEEHYKGYVNDIAINKLDEEGKEIALLIKKELKDVKLEYFSDARLMLEII